MTEGIAGISVDQHLGRCRSEQEQDPPDQTVAEATLPKDADQEGQETLSNALAMSSFMSRAGIL
jgi:hypothetical protein